MGDQPLFVRDVDDHLVPEDELRASMQMTPPTPVEELEAWLRNAFDTELPGTLEKAVLYGSADLEIMADAMGKMMPHLQNDAQRLQAAIAFYLLGKVARAMGALRDGREPTADTWYDAHIYSMMALKIQETGHWLRH